VRGGHAPKDRFIVKDGTASHLDWNGIHQPRNEE
jgi:ATP-dependent phosphoenolpyruvate carboxykinase